MSRLTFVVIVLFTSSALAAPQYEVTNLTEAFYEDFGYPTLIEKIAITSMNDSGQFVGTLTLPGGVEDVFVWEIGSQPVLAGINADYLGSNTGITNNGKIAGAAWNFAPRDQQLYVWDTVSGSLSYTPITDIVDIVDINKHGSIVADKSTPEGTATVLFKGNTVQEALGNVSAINDSGTVVGHYYTQDPEVSLGPCKSSQGFLWDSEGNKTDIGYFTTADINNSGQVIGWNEEILAMYSNGTSDRQQYSVFWEDGELYDIGMLEGCRSTQLYYLNDSAQAVGTASGIAIYWDRENGLLDINKLILGEPSLHLYNTDSITNNGNILARGYFAGEVPQPPDSPTSFLLTPVSVPEPGTLTLLVGLFSVLAFRSCVIRKP